MRAAKGLLLVMILAALGGCLPSGADSGGSSVARVTIRYQVTTQIIQEEIYADPIQTAKTVSVIHETNGTFSPNASGQLYSGNATPAGVTATAMVLLDTAGNTVLSLQANRDQVFGVSDEWERVDNIVAGNIPIVNTAANVDTYRLTGSDACEAITVLFYSEARSPTTAIPEAGPSYVVVDQNEQTCDQDSYIEVEIEYQN